MCLLLIAHQVSNSYPLIVLANRDEFYERPTRNAQWWPDLPDILAGKDLKAGGTWLGLNKKGRFAALTNFRDPNGFNPKAKSRGSLVISFLKTNQNAATYITELENEKNDFNDFNLIMYENQTLSYYSSKANSFQELNPGYYAISNGFIDSNWFKMSHGKSALKRLVESEISIEGALNILTHPEEANENLLPSTGVSKEMEKLLSPIFIQSPKYGSRSSNVILFKKNEIDYFEKNHLSGETFSTSVSI